MKHIDMKVDEETLNALLTQEDIEGLKQYLDILVEKAKEVDEKNAHKSQYSNAYARRAKIVAGISPFLQHTGKYSFNLEFDNGLLFIVQEGDRVVTISCRKRTYRVKGSPDWLMYGSEDSLLRKVLNKLD